VGRYAGTGSLVKCSTGELTETRADEMNVFGDVTDLP
jgi:hypothetical protein